MVYRCALRPCARDAGKPMMEDNTTPTILDTMVHPSLFGPHFRGTSWDGWKALLAATFRSPDGRCATRAIPPAHRPHDRPDGTIYRGVLTAANGRIPCPRSRVAWTRRPDPVRLRPVRLPDDTAWTASTKRHLFHVRCHQITVHSSGIDSHSCEPRSPLGRGREAVRKGEGRALGRVTSNQRWDKGVTAISLVNGPRSG